MAQFDDLMAIPENFTGVVRLFPLPNLVMFPHVMQPLHLFEPRYVQLLRDALAGDRLIAMALLAPGWELDYKGRPPICPVACLGKIVTHVPAEGNGQNILLLGLQRVAIQAELPPHRSYREARVTLLDDECPPADERERQKLRRELLSVFRELVPESSPAQEQVEQLAGSNVPLGALTDIVAFTIDLPLETKQQLLSETHVPRRARQLLTELRKLWDVERRPSFPPQFSDN